MGQIVTCTCMGRKSPVDERLSKLPVDFFRLADAKARLFTDVKIDDCIALWYFVWLNYQRQPSHTVSIEVCVVGIKDFESGVRLAKDVCRLASEHAQSKADKKALPTISFTVYGSKNPHDVGPRHEADTYGPYQGATPAWSKEPPQAVQYYDEQINPNEKQPDLIWVFAQFFNWEVRDWRASSFDFVKDFDQKLAFLTPGRNGWLCFQYGFNVGLRKGKLEHYQRLWSAVKDKVQMAGGHILMISNLFSFSQANANKKPSQVSPSSPWLMNLQNLSGIGGDMWKHLVNAAKIEGMLFACDQMAKWLADTEDVNLPEGKSLADHGFDAEIKRFRQDRSIPESGMKAMAAFLKSQFVEDEAVRGERENKVLTWSKDLHAAVQEKFGDFTADYLGRAVVIFGNFGKHIEVTDGLQMVAAMQGEFVARAMFVDNVEKALVDVVPTEDPGHDGVLWMAKDLPDRCLDWMLDVQDVGKVARVFQALSK